MTIQRERAPVSTTPALRPAPSVSHMTEWIVGAVGALAAVVGSWMYYGPADGTLSLFWWDWNVSELAQAWPLSLLVGGGALLATAFGWFASKMYRRRYEVDGSVLGATVLSLAALAGAVVFALIWIF